MNMMALPAQRRLTGPSNLPFSQSAVGAVAVACDGLAVVAPGIVAYMAHVGWPTAVTPHATTLGLFAAGVVGITALAGGYDSDAIRRPWRAAPRVVLAMAVMFFALVTLGFGLKLSDEVSRAWAFLTAAGGVASVAALRVSYAQALQARARAGSLTRNIAIIGNTHQAQRMLQRIQLLNEPWNRVIGVFDDGAETGDGAGQRVGALVFGAPVLGEVEDLLALARHTRIDDVVIALPWSAEDRIHRIVARLHELPVSIRLAPDLVGLSHKAPRFGTLAGVPTLDLARHPGDGWQAIAKRLSDKVLAAALLIALAPLLLLIAAVVKLESPGPALYRQTRYGFNNRPFTVFKFRSMRHGDHRLGAGLRQATANDPRVTRVGRLLRRTSLDELPQLFNVLNGSMSLVGPRPHAVAHNEQYADIIAGYSARHRVRPGITGWAQVNGLRGETETADKMRARVAYDIYYIENWSLLLDLRILLRTTVVGFLHKNAY